MSTTVQNLKGKVRNVSASTPERAIERVEMAFGMMLYKPQAEAEEVIDLNDHIAEIIEIGYEQDGDIQDFGEALRVFCERRKQPATIINLELVEKRFHEEFSNEGDGSVTFGI